MKRIWKAATILLIAALAFAAAVSLPQLRSHARTQESQEERPPTRTLSLSATASIKATPDIAVITVSVQTKNDSAAQALAANSQQMHKVFQTLEQYGVEKKDIRTTNVSLYLREERDDKGHITKRYYVANNTVQITVRDIAKVGEVLDAVVSDGANRVQGIRFDVSNRDELLKQAELAAVKQARERAEAIAQAAGVEIGQVQSISLQSTGPRPRPILEMSVAKSTTSVPISGGEMSISATVNMVFTLK